MSDLDRIRNAGRCFMCEELDEKIDRLEKEKRELIEALEKHQDAYLELNFSKAVKAYREASDYAATFWTNTARQKETNVSDLNPNIELEMKKRAEEYASGKRCGCCGMETVEVRGRYPSDKKRLVCPDCMASRLDQIRDISAPDYGHAKQAKS